MSTPQRNALNRQAGHVTPRIRRAVYDRDGWLCRMCGDGMPSPGGFSRLTVDHIIPLTRGGVTSLGNLQTLCLPCNSRKSNLLPIHEWFRQLFEEEA